MALPIQSIPISNKIHITRKRLYATCTTLLGLMKRLRPFGEKFQYFSRIVLAKLDLFCKCVPEFFSHLHQLLIYQTDPLWIQLCYFTSASFVGFLILKCLGPNQDAYGTTDLDLFFMSASAATVSSMSTTEIEILSSSQLVILALLMLVGGEVFTSLLDLQLLKSKMKNTGIDRIKKAVDLHNSIDPTSNTSNQTELELIPLPDLGRLKTNVHSPTMDGEEVKKNSIRILSLVVFGYLLLAHITGFVSIFAYFLLFPSARNVIQKKGCKAIPFSLFMTISSFANGGFAPINENMAAFKKNSGILSLVVPLILMGNTLFPPCLRLTIRVLKRFRKMVEFDYLLDSDGEIEFRHLLSNSRSTLLVLTVLGFIMFQTILLCFMEWNSEALNGLNSYQKVMGALFQSVNARHAGESIFNLSVLSPAILVSYIIMMYLPPYTTFIPIEERCTSRIATEEKRSMSLLRSLILSQLSYLAIFIILICITERRKLSEDPLNFNVLNIVLEVISAYGNVGFSTGYSCERRLQHEGDCKDAWYGFVGKWSSKGKIILIFVMFFGRLKKFNMNGGKAWKLE